MFLLSNSAYKPLYKYSSTGRSVFSILACANITFLQGRDEGKLQPDRCYERHLTSSGLDSITDKGREDKEPKTDQTGIYLFFARKEKVELNVKKLYHYHS